MRVALPGLVITDEERRQVRAELGGTGLATDQEIRDWASELILNELDAVCGPFGVDPGAGEAELLEA
jgi:hypothetical protein